MSSLVGNIVSNKCCLNLEAICMSRHIGNKNHRQFCMVYTGLVYFKRRKLRLFPYIFSSQEGQWIGWYGATIDNQMKYFNYSLFELKVMCQKSALQCQLTCLYALYTVNPSPLPPSQQYTLSWELRKFSLQNIPSAGYIIHCNQILHWNTEATQWCRGLVQD